MKIDEAINEHKNRKQNGERCNGCKKYIKAGEVAIFCYIGEMYWDEAIPEGDWEVIPKAQLTRQEDYGIYAAYHAGCFPRPTSPAPAV